MQRVSSLLPGLVCILGFSAYSVAGHKAHPDKRCCLTHPIIITDRLETYVHASYGQCAATGVGYRDSYYSHPSGQIDVWLLAVSAVNTSVPICEKDISLDVVDSFGLPVEGPTVVPAKVTSNRCGRNDQRITIHLNRTPGVFRVRCKYEDKKVEAIGYGPPIISTSSGH